MHSTFWQYTLGMNRASKLDSSSWLRFIGRSQCQSSAPNRNTSANNYVIPEETDTTGSLLSDQWTIRTKEDSLQAAGEDMLHSAQLEAREVRLNEPVSSRDWTIAECGTTRVLSIAQRIHFGRKRRPFLPRGWQQRFRRVVS